ncbi:hypothetical protein N900_18800 [Vibrio cholerae O1 str. KW3]|nr:hypothetical protein N900_18800 [Vibrio cholerae O1 str. KW3]
MQQEYLSPKSSCALPAVIDKYQWIPSFKIVYFFNQTHIDMIFILML